MMFRMSKITLPLLAVIWLAVVGTGCVNFDYVGRTFAETPDDVRIAYFTDRSDLPPGKYSIIGRATLTAPDGEFDTYSLREFLEAEARERGADAVCVVEAKRIKVGTYAIEDGGSFAGPSAYRSNPDNVSPTGEPLETNTFGQQVTLTGETHYRWDFEVKALFYKDKVELGRIMDERKQQLAKFTSSDQEVEATPGEGQEAENSGVSVSEEKGEADK